MGLFTFQLKCGCVEVTSTLEKEPKTFTLSYCKEHKPPELESPVAKPKETEKKQEIRKTHTK